MNAPNEFHESRNDRFQRDVLPMSVLLLSEARRLTRNQADAEDLVQETLLRAYLGFDGYRDGTNLQAWLGRIMRNSWISGFRARQRRPAEVLTEATDDRTFFTDNRERFSRSQSSAEELVLSAIPDEDLLSAIRSLPASMQLTLYYADVADYPVEKVARLIDVPVGTVMSRLFRARRRLRVLLAARETRSTRSAQSQ